MGIREEHAGPMRMPRRRTRNGVWLILLDKKRIIKQNWRKSDRTRQIFTINVQFLLFKDASTHLYKRDCPSRVFFNEPKRAENGRNAWENCLNAPNSSKSIPNCPKMSKVSKNFPRCPKMSTSDASLSEWTCLLEPKVVDLRFFSRVHATLVHYVSMSVSRSVCP